MLAELSTETSANAVAIFCPKPPYQCLIPCLNCTKLDGTNFKGCLGAIYMFCSTGSREIFFCTRARARSRVHIGIDSASRLTAPTFRLDASRAYSWYLHTSNVSSYAIEFINANRTTLVVLTCSSASVLIGIRGLAIYRYGNAYNYGGVGDRLQAQA